MEYPNLNYINELSGDDSSFKVAFIDILKREFPDEISEYMNNIKNEHPREASLNVHKLKHKFNILGLEQGYELSVLYEEELRSGDISLHEKFVAILNQIELFLKTI
tara:strand:+ start:5661 stop:5978 length:318 start_codon:yes stop_codon:yes gene_type:complete